MERRKALLAAVIAASLTANVAQAADVVILDSTVAALAPGDVLPDTREVSVPAGAFLSVILASGETILVKGPYSGPIGAMGDVSAPGVAELTGARGGETKVLGAVRAPKWEKTN